MADELNSPSHRWYQPRYNIALAPSDVSKQFIYDSGIQKIDAFINGGSPAFSPTALFALAEPGIWLDPSDVANLDWRRNLLLWSEQFDNTSWTKTATTIDANVIAAPDGTMTADKIVDTAVTGAHTIAHPALAYAAGTQYTLSAYFKAAERTWAYLVLSSTPFGTTTRAWFDLSAVTTGTVQNCTPVITDVGDGWRRCSITATTTVGGSISAPATLGVSPSDGGSSYLGVVGSGIYAWGAQLELGSAPSTYQPITDLNTEVIALFPNATMYQDTGGIAPVTTPGQSVGLRLDKSKALALGTDLITNGDFASDTVWTKGVGWSIAAGVASITSSAASNAITQAIGVAGRVYQITYTVVSVSAQGFRAFAGGTNGAVRSVAGTYTETVVCGTTNTSIGIGAWATGTTGSIDNVSVKEIAGNHAFQATAGSRMTYGIEPKTGTRNILLATDTMATQSRTVTAVAHTLAFTGTGTITLTGASTAGPLAGTGVSDRVSLTFTPTAASLTLTVSGSVTLAQLELGSTATAYQRVTTAFDVTEAGVASCHYCQYDGTDDSMSTAAIDFTSTDAMSVFAGIFKRTDATLGVFLESSVDAVNTAGTFSLRAPNTTASAAYSYLSRGTALAQVATPTTFPAPRYNLVSGLSDISVDQCVIRVNGAQVGTSATDQGTGNYGNHQLFIGRRNNTSLQFAGRDYGIIIVGKAVSAGDLASTETWLAAKTPGVTL